jgi:hypothetical protein
VEGAAGAVGLHDLAEPTSGIERDDATGVLSPHRDP